MTLKQAGIGLVMLALLGGSLLAVGCQDVSPATSAPSTEGGDTASTTVATVTTVAVPSTEGMAIQFGGDGEASLPGGSSNDPLVGSWSYHNTEVKGDGYTESVTFEADGAIWVSIKPDDPQYEGDAVEGTWRVEGNTLWIYGIGMDEYSVRYSIQGDTLKMPSPGDPDKLVRTYRR